VDCPDGWKSPGSGSIGLICGAIRLPAYNETRKKIQARADGEMMREVALTEGALTGDQVRAIDRFWRAANYLSVGQIYLRDNPLLRDPLKIEHVKPRLLGHWGTTPGLNFIHTRGW
jgi:XFP-like protein